MLKSILVLAMSFSFQASTFAITEEVYVESPTDTDRDGVKDLIYVSIKRPNSNELLSTIYKISPYTLGGDDSVPFHNTDMNYLPQDEQFRKSLNSNQLRPKFRKSLELQNSRPQYAKISAHSLGTGYSKGCPTVGDMSETLAAKAVIDWLNGSAKGFDKKGKEVFATWSNGKVAMTGISYNGTLPIMVATTGVKGLKAIVPIAAISNWYDYYRANGLVVNPGGYIGEDADILGKYIVRKNACVKEMNIITNTMGRENGDFTKFWQDRNYLDKVKNIQAAVFIIHGQNDWNVKQKHATKLFEALTKTNAPRKLFLHRGGHGSTYSHGVPSKINDWIDHYLEGIDNGINRSPKVEVELPTRELITQNSWPHEETKSETFYFHSSGELSQVQSMEHTHLIIDSGKDSKLESLIKHPLAEKTSRLVFQTNKLERNLLLSGTAKIQLNLSVLNRKAANLSIAIIEYKKWGLAKIVTRGWADPQNNNDITSGKLLIPGKEYSMIFELEPKQHSFSKGSKLGVLITATDKDYTLRPSAGTKIEFRFNEDSFIRLDLK